MDELESANDERNIEMKLRDALIVWRPQGGVKVGLLKDNR